MTTECYIVKDGTCSGQCYERVYHVLDIVLSFTVIFPLVIFYWRGTWDLWDYYCAIDCRMTHGNITQAHEHGMQHENIKADCLEVTGNWISAVLGMGVCVLSNCSSPFMHRGAKDFSKTVYHVTSRLYSYAYALAYLGQWRGVWNLIDAYCSDYGWQSNLDGLIVCLAFLFIFRLNRHWTSSPWVTALDTDQDVFHSRPWLQSSTNDCMWRYCTNQILSQMVCVNLNIATWRCLWNCLDDSILPDKLELSAMLTLFAGAILILFLIVIQPHLSRYSATLDDDRPLQRTLLDGCFYVIVNVGVIGMWRGLWNLVAEYVIPDMLHGGWACHIIGTVGLMVTQCFRTVYDNSVDLDGVVLGGGSLNPDNMIIRRWIQFSQKHKNVPVSVCPETSKVQNGLHIPIHLGHQTGHLLDDSDTSIS